MGLLGEIKRGAKKLIGKDLTLEQRKELQRNARSLAKRNGRRILKSFITRRIGV